MRQLLAIRRPAQAMLLFAIFLPAILAVVGLLYSIGFVLIERRALQTAADAASTAATWSLLYELESGDRTDGKVWSQVQTYALQESGATFSAVYTDQSGLPLGGPVAVGSGGSFPSAARGVQVKVQKNVSIVLDRLIGISGILTAATSTAALVPASPPSPTPPVLPVAVNLQNDFALAMNTGAIYDLLAPTTLPPGALTPLLDFGQSPAAAFAPGGRPPDYGYSQHPPLSDDPTGPSSIFTNLQLWSDARHAPALLSLGPSATLSLAPPPPLANSVFMDPEFTAQQLDAYKDAFAAGLRDTIRQQGRTDASGSAYGLVLVPLWDSAGSGTVHVAGAGLIRLRLQDVSSSSAKGRFLLYPAAAWGVPPATAPTPDVGARLVRLIA